MKNQVRQTWFLVYFELELGLGSVLFKNSFEHFRKTRRKLPFIRTCKEQVLSTYSELVLSEESTQVSNKTKSQKIPKMHCETNTKIKFYIHKSMYLLELMYLFLATFCLVLHVRAIFLSQRIFPQRKFVYCHFDEILFSFLTWLLFIKVKKLRNHGLWIAVWYLMEFV